MPDISRYTPQALAVLRIVAALLFIEHGTEKLFSFPTAMHGHGGSLPAIMLVAGILETFGGIAILLGLLTRPVAFILSGEMAVAFWTVHVSHGGFFPANNGGDAAVLFCFVFIYLVFAGPGDWALDAMLKRNSQN